MVRAGPQLRGPCIAGFRERVVSAEDLFGGIDQLEEATLAAVNEAAVANAVRAGQMPAAVLDHIGHLKFNIYNPACEYCTRPVSPDSGTDALEGGE
jgi:hypothetical protein